SFDKMGLKRNLLRGVYAYGLEKPSPIQQRAIEPLMRGRDLIMQAQSGMGKTAAFVIAILQKLDISVKATQALIIVPTRELAQQTQQVVLALGQYMNVKCHACIGGKRLRGDVQKLEAGVHVVVGTIGRLLCMIEREALLTDKIKLLCLDEADEMLSSGWREQIDKGRSFPTHLPQIVLLSATMPPDSLKSMRKMTRGNPITILVKQEQLTLEGIQQFFILMENESWKLETLCDLYAAGNFTHPTVVFCNTRVKVDSLLNELNGRELPASATHGKKTQKRREALLQDFRTGSSRILITTDMLSRGIDIQTVAVVVNYDLPDKIESYMHRVGRSGRFGRKGIAINFVTEANIETLRGIERYYSTQIEEMPLGIS
ncbi:DEAD box RNA helicase RH2a, partial [Hysterangium stoloniferum]